MSNVVPNARDKPYTFKPRQVTNPEWNQEQVYDYVMKSYTERFLDGYHVNVMAYGQTGSGKTYTMIAPYGSMKKNSGCSAESPPDDFGLYLRCCLDVFNQTQNMKNVKLTMSSSEISGVCNPTDMITKKEAIVDKDSNEIRGLTEIVIETPDDILKVGKIIEKERTTSGHKKNANSSRTHCLCELKMYKTTGKELTVANLKFLDLCGSEKVS